MRRVFNVNFYLRSAYLSIRCRICFLALQAIRITDLIDDFPFPAYPLRP